MQLETQYLVDYIISNPDESFYATCPVSRLNIELTVSDSRYSVKLGSPVDATFKVGEFNRLENSDTDVSYVISEELISKVRQHVLNRLVAWELYNVKEAVVEIFNHEASLTDDTLQLHIFKLKNPDFYIPGKGRIIFFCSPTGAKVLDPLKSYALKGYVSDGPGEIHQIKYESVQAWRYERLTRDNAPHDTPESIIDRLSK